MAGISFLLFSSAWIVGCGPEEGGRPPVSLAIRNTTIVDVSDGSVVPEQTVLVSGQRIVGVGSSTVLSIPDSALVFDGEGKFVIPGLWDMHVHVLLGSTQPPPRGRAGEADLWEYWKTVHGPMARIMLAHGITGFRDMWGDLELVRLYKDRQASGPSTWPRVVAAGQLVGGRPIPIFPGIRVTRTAQEGERVVDSLAAAGADFIKVYEGLSESTFRAIMGRADELDLPVSGHVPSDVPLETAVATGQRSLEHITTVTRGCGEGQPGLDWVDFSKVAEQDCPELGPFMAEEDVWITPTLVAFGGAQLERSWSTKGELDYVPEWRSRGWWRPSTEQLEDIDSVLAPLRRRHEAWRTALDYFSEAGVSVLAGTDLAVPHVVPGHSLHQELELMVAAGLTPLAALQAATIEPARYLQATDSLGSIRPDAMADMVILEGNPLEDISNSRRISAVVANGQLLDRDELDEILSESKRGLEASAARYAN